MNAYYLNPTSKDCNKQMPGDLRGISSSNNEEILSSFGMMNVELSGSNGEGLQIATGKTATLTFPVDASLTANAPATIPLWFFDETKGLWVQQGTATKSGNNYVGTVSHFTWWNCDWGGGPLDINATFVDQNKNALDNYHVYFVTQGGIGAGGGHGYTASDETINGRIPANKQIKMVVAKWQNCSSSIETILLDSLIRPFTTNTNLDTVKVNIPNFNTTTITIKGNVNDCNNSPVVKGYALIQIGSDLFYSHISNGIFNKTITFCNSVPTATATITVFDLTTLKQNATPITKPITGSGTYNITTVQACGVQNFIRYTATFINQNGNLISKPHYIYIKDLSSGDSVNLNSGVATTILKANTIYNLKFYYAIPCNGWQVIDSMQIGPYTSDFNAGTIVVNTPTTSSGLTFTLTGAVNTCSNTPVVKGTASFTINGITMTTPITNGSFKIILNCYTVNSQTSTITVTDDVNHQQNSTPITATIANGMNNIGTVQACGVSIQEFLNYTVGSTTYNADSLSAKRRSGLTYISGMGVSPFSNFDGNFNGNAIGKFDFNITHSDATMTQYTSTQGTKVTVTEFGSVGGYIVGTFSGNVTASLTSPNIPISGSFRIKRVQ